MIFPVVVPRVKQFRQCSCCRVDSSQVRTFVQIAIDARQSEVFKVVRATVSFGNYVLDMKHGERRVVLVKVAILTCIAGAFPYPSFRTRQHVLRPRPD